MSKFVFEVTREFVSKAFGAIGKSGWRVTESGAAEMLREAKWVAVPTSTRDALAMFALQTLQDAYAGAKTASEAVGSFDKKLDAYIEGTVGTRATSWESVAREFIVAALVARDATFKGLKGDDRTAAIDAALAKNVDKPAFRATVDAEIAKRAEEAAKLRAMASAVDL
jgi:hypothetical protein